MRINLVSKKVIRNAVYKNDIQMHLIIIFDFLPFSVQLAVMIWNFGFVWIFLLTLWFTSKNGINNLMFSRNTSKI